jgi:hypothetical protein
MNNRIKRVFRIWLFPCAPQCVGSGEAAKLRNVIASSMVTACTEARMTTQTIAATAVDFKKTLEGNLSCISPAYRRGWTASHPDERRNQIVYLLLG